MSSQNESDDYNEFNDDLIFSDDNIDWIIDPKQIPGYTILTSSWFASFIPHGDWNVINKNDIPAAIQIQQESKTSITVRYSGYKITTDQKKIQQLADNIKVHSGAEDIIPLLTGIKTFLSDEKGQVYFAPWEMDPYYLPDTELENLDYDGTYWSALKFRRPILDCLSVNQELEYTLKSHPYSDMDTTHTVLKYELTAWSQSKLCKYPNLKYKFQDGRTQIWTNDAVVVKLSFEKTLYNNECHILALNITDLPPLLEAWTSENENFLVMANRGTTLNNCYIFDCLIPDCVRVEQEMIKNNLLKYGLKHYDDHSCNYVIQDNKLTMIDAEVIMYIADYDNIDTPNYVPRCQPAYFQWLKKNN